MMLFTYNSYDSLYLFTARVVPMDVSATPSILSTNVHWKFDGKVEKQIMGFRMEVLLGTVCKEVNEIQSKARTATLSGLESGIACSVKVVAVYSDGARGKSTTVSFTTPSM